MKKTLAFLLTLGFLAGSANASVLVGWDVAGMDQTDLPEPFYSVFNATGVQVGSISIADSGLVPALTTTNSYNLQNWSTGATFQAAKDDESYFSITVAPEPGWTLNITNVQIRVARHASAASEFALASSLDDFDTALATFTRTQTGAGNITMSSLDPTDFDGITSAIEFRLYGWNASGTWAGARIMNGADFGEGDTGFDFVVNGSAIPEPGTMAVLLLGFGCVAMWRRRMRA